MKFGFAGWLLGLFAFGAMVSALAVSEPTTKIWIPSWDMPVHPESDETIVVNGTIEEVHSFMEKRYPGYAERWANVSSHGDNHGKLSKRKLEAVIMNIRSWMCTGPFGQSKAAEIQKGIDMLNKIPIVRTPRNGPGPRSCGRVSCAYDASIVWCNDTEEEMVLKSFHEIGAAAQLLLNRCTHNNFYRWLAGQMFFIGDWAIIAGQWACYIEYNTGLNNR
ncbi:hypothetical protein E4U21_007748 [Claviceps maximensis]|nr:hypothetical protein E4U21_007748 [Claviceps maximensis]